jgi:hypothetical protein
LVPDVEALQQNDGFAVRRDLVGRGRAHHTGADDGNVVDHRRILRNVLVAAAFGLADRALEDRSLA